MDNKDMQNKKSFISRKRNAYFFIGFLVGIIPFGVLILILSASKNMYASTQLFQNTLLVIGILASIANAFILRNRITKHLEILLNCSYK